MVEYCLVIAAQQQIDQPANQSSTMKDSVEPDVELTPAATSTPAAALSTSTAQPLQPDLTMEPEPGRK